MELSTLTTSTGLTYRTRTCGPADGTPVMLLHGFPTTSAIWTDALTALGAAGFRAVAPDQRGYSPQARPSGAASYRYSDIAGDVVELANAAGFERFHLVGHDFGAIAGWASLPHLGSRVATWSALSVPHLRAFGSGILHDPDQRSMSVYVHRLAAPGGVDELVDEWSRSDFAELRADWSPNTPAAMRDDFVAVLTEQGALEAAYNWYAGTRGIAPTDDDGTPFPDTAVPTLFLWGRRDPFVSRSSVVAAQEMMAGSYRFVELDGGHWLQIDARDQVIDEILRHIHSVPL